jgi:hypothetical protein
MMIIETSTEYRPNKIIAGLKFIDGGDAENYWYSDMKARRQWNKMGDERINQGGCEVSNFGEQESIRWSDDGGEQGSMIESKGSVGEGRIYMCDSKEIKVCKTKRRRNAGCR